MQDQGAEESGEEKIFVHIVVFIFFNKSINFYVLGIRSSYRLKIFGGNYAIVITSLRYSG